MTKTEALRMAIKALEDALTKFSTFNEMQHDAIQACKEALEQPADGIELEWYCKGWDDAEKDLATQEPVLVNATTHDGQTYKIEVSAPSRDWVGLSDDEIEEGFKEGWVTKQAFESSVWWAEAKLKEKNNGT